MAKIDIGKRDFGTLCICALRYCHGRRTYMPSEVQRIVSEHFSDLSNRDLAVIEQDKSFQSHMDLWGDQCDKADWLRFYRDLKKYTKESELSISSDCQWK